MCPVFFFGSRPNYARWMVKYYHNLLNMDNTHPGVRSVLENGALSIRRSVVGRRDKTQEIVQKPRVGHLLPFI